MNDSDHIDQIAAYLDNAMSPEEKTAFEARIQADSALAHEVESLRALGEHSRGFFRKEAIVHEIVSQNRNKAQKALWKRPAFRFVMVIAAGLILLLLLRSLLVKEKTLDNQALFAQYFEIYDESGLSVERGASTSTDLWREAGDAYRKGDYATAETGFSTIIKQDSTDIPARFYYANSLLAEEQASSAITHLQYIVMQEDFLYGRQAKWFLALAFIKNEQPQQAIPLLKALQRERDSLGEQAKRLEKAIQQ